MMSTSSVRIAAWAVVALWLPYTALNTLFPGPQITYALGLALALLGLLLLRRAGISPGVCFVRVAPLSWQGALWLLPLLLAIPAAWLAGRFQGWNWLDNVVYAPLSALAQELYFRAALLAALTILCGGRRLLPLLLQSALFGLWHLRAFGSVPLLPAVGILVATAFAGFCWGMQARRDRTILYAWLEHTLLLAAF